ncbi:MAG: B12-binding domain-containing radical SAM protein [Planctomycetota bacterium]|jgi:hypothetical protein
MKLALISPPATSSFAPTMALVALRSYLESHGVSVTPIDANIGAVHYTLQPERHASYVEPYRRMLQKGLPSEAKQQLTRWRMIDAGDEPPALDEARFEAVQEHLRTIWTPEGFSTRKADFDSQLAAINDALILASLSMYPEWLTIWGEHSPIGLVRTHERNPFLHYFRDELIPQLKELAPDAIGISLCYFYQVFFGSNLAHMIRQAGLDVPILFGGSYFSELPQFDDPTQPAEAPVPESAWTNRTGAIGSLLGMRHPLSGRPIEAPNALSAGVFQEGEQPLLEICRRLDAGESILDLPNLVYPDPGAQTVHFNPAGEMLAGKDIPPADLAGLGIGVKYVSPLRLAPLMTSRGCYWDKCTFCTHARTLGKGYRQASADVVADSMAAYKRDFGVELVLFTDESLSPAMMRQLTERMEADDLTLRYASFSQIEQASIPLLESAAQRGLTVMCLGLESACDRVLTLMNKSHRRADSQAVLDECDRHGVRVLYFVIFGFPGETDAEAEETLSYLDSVREKVWLIAPYPWAMVPDSYIGKHPEEFGITFEASPQGQPAASPFTIDSGMDAHQARQWVARLSSHPRLKDLVVVNEHEDCRLVRDLVKEIPPEEWPSSGGQT